MRNLFIVTMVALSISAFAQIPTNGLVAWYPFNGNANDGTANGLNGIVNGATLTADRFGNSNSAYLFDGSSNFIEIPDDNLLDLSDNFSLCAWIKVNDSVQIEQAIIGKQRLSGHTGYNLLFNNVSFGMNNGSQNQIVYLSTQICNKGWHLLIGTYNGSVGKLYIDGDSVAFKTFSMSLLNSTMPVYIGKEFANGRYFDGIIDDVRIYNRALSASEISALYDENICYQTITVTDTLIINANITGYNPIIYQNSVKIYPNPTSDHITIDFGSNYETMNGYTLKITNSLSQVVLISSVNQQQTTVDLSTWTGKGVYFVHLIDAQSNTIDIRKIVLQ